MKNKEGWTFFFNDNTPSVNYKDELKQNIRRFLIDISMLFPFLISLLLLFIYLKVSKKPKKNKILLGTIPIIIFELISKLLTKHNIENTHFVFTDWTDGNFHSDLEFKDICPIKFLNKDPYKFGGYIAFLWALKNFNIFALYFNGGFLERTIFWRMEPIIYQIFGKKTLLIPFGGDTWGINKNQNRVQKLGHMMSDKRYFLLDKKREERIYHWSKYVNTVIAYINYMDYLPKIDVLVYHGHVMDDINKYNYYFKEAEKIKIIHCTGNKLKKGGQYIEDVLKNSSFTNEIEFCYGVKRDIALAKLDNSHFYIEQLIDGFFSYSAIEAMLKGKIIFLYLDENIHDIYKLINNTYYIDFFNNSPMVNVNINSIESKIQEYLNKDFSELQEISLKSKNFAKKLLEENEKMYINIFKDLIK